ncbi:hypothetical protein PLICRDRAFT_170374 [Plicaturopsis crispa FD-325 SS-3]|nr:hypothetical protein PLICRDRAFT_170374 [Plicaturopsis crispa FD-325 SS-3]
MAPPSPLKDEIKPTPVKIWTVHIEVRVSLKATTRHDTIRHLVHSYLTSSCDRIYLPSTIQGWEEVPTLASSVERIVASESACPSTSLPLDEIAFKIHVYQPSDGDAFEEMSGGGDDGAEEVMAATVCELPNRGWDGLWDSLIYSDDIKLKLLEYIHATLILSDANVDFNLVSWNRVILLHGPPGTGKTSLCRALAQKLSIRLSHRYPHSRLLEINSHSLFSRWFSESGKLVQRLFASINELIDEEDTFVVVLIDEVESLTAARAGAMAGTEPSDGLRVVNALLTQLDKLKHRKNVLVMSTSNLVKAIDSAFVDRADIIQYVDLPPSEAIYEILRGSLSEIIGKGLINAVDVPTLAQAKLFERLSAESTTSFADQARNKTKHVATKLLALSARCRKQRMSGRALRRLPVLALARYIGLGFSRLSVSPESTTATNGGKQHHNKSNGFAAQEDGDATGAADVEVWLEAMEKVVEDQATEQEKLDAL